MTVAIALSSASGVGSRSPALVRGTRAPAVRLAQHLGVAPLKSEAYGKNKASSRIRFAPRVKVVESMRMTIATHRVDHLPRALAEGTEGAESKRLVVHLAPQLLVVNDLAVVTDLLGKKGQSTTKLPTRVWPRSKLPAPVRMYV